MIIYIAFPTVGKTYFCREQNQVDLDRGFIRKMLGYNETTSKNKQAINELTLELIKYFKNEDRKIIFTNDPDVADLINDDVKFVFIVPAYDKEEFLRRIIERGDNPNSEWVKDMYNNYDEYIRSWETIADKKNALIVSVHHLSDYMYL